MTEYLREHSVSGPGLAPRRTLKDLRTAAGLTQTALASEIGSSQPSYSFWEAGRAWPTIDLLPALARAFGVTVDELVAALIVTRKAAS